jgi:Protein of unknown function (DUF1573)
MKIPAILLLISCCYWANAQKAEALLFREKVHDFGEVMETGGGVDYQFTFTNNAGRPVRILSVKASCGCTTPDWSKEPIAQGKTGFVKVNFDPRGKPGYFNKSLTITTDLDGNGVVLQIKGQVVAAIKGVEEIYPSDNGSLRLKTNSFNMGKVFINRDAAVAEFEIYNSAKKSIHFSKSIAPPYIAVTVPDSIASNAKGKIRLAYNAKVKNQYGFVSDNVELLTDDEKIPRKSFSVYATIEEYFAPLTTDEADKAPKFDLEISSADLGKTKPGTILSKTVRVRNSGKKELQIHAMQPNCTCLTIQASKTSIKEGEEAELQISMNTQGRTGTLQKAVTIYSNDPRNPVQRITLSVYIED